MGNMQLLGMLETGKSLDVVLQWHLQHNHFPALPLAMIEPAKQAIEAGNCEQWDMLIDLPKGMQYRGQTAATASALIEALHLGSFIERIE